MERALRLLERPQVPVHRIWLDVAEKPEVPPGAREQLDIDEMTKLAKDLMARFMSTHKTSLESALYRLRHTEPFDQFPEILAALEK